MEILISILIYFLCFSFSLTACVLYQDRCKNLNHQNISIIEKVFWFLSIIIAPVLISTIRYNVGTDYFSYVSIFRDVNCHDLKLALKLYGKEPFFLFLNKLAFLLFHNEIGVFFLSSFLIHLFIIWGIDYFKSYISMPLALFIYYSVHFIFGLNGIRQMIAISIIFFGLRFIYQKKLWFYVLSVITATMFHNTAIFCIVFYFMVYEHNIKIYRLKKTIYYIAILFSPILLMYGIKLASKIPFFNHYLHYAKQDVDLGLGFLLEIAPVIFPFFVYKKSIIDRNKYFEPIILLSLLNLPFQYVGYFINWGSRLVLYTNSIYYILVPLVINSVKNSKNKILLFVYYIMIFSLYFIITFVIKNYHEAFPYITIFEKNI